MIECFKRIYYIIYLRTYIAHFRPSIRIVSLEIRILNIKTRRNNDNSASIRFTTFKTNSGLE